MRLGAPRGRQQGGGTPMSKYTITKVAWYTQRKGDPFPREHVVTQFRTLARFLDETGLSSRKLLDPVDREIGDDVGITTEDVTEEGHAFMKQGYVKWLNAVDRGKPPDDDTILKRELAKLRAAKAT
jgi:hypothetical protein